MTWAYRLFFAVDVIAVLVLGYFFVDGLQYVGAGEALGLWLAILAVPIGALLIGFSLHEKGRTGAATAVLAIPAVPALLFVAFFALLIGLNPRWN